MLVAAGKGFALDTGASGQDHCGRNHLCRSGSVLLSIVAALIYEQMLDRPAVLGMALIISGIVVMQGFSSSAGH